jgi:hypothetical protein
MLRASVDAALVRPAQRAVGRIQSPGDHSISHRDVPVQSRPPLEGQDRYGRPVTREPATTRDHTSRALSAFDGSAVFLELERLTMPGDRR